MTVYLDSDFKCHGSNPDGVYTAVETDFFEGFIWEKGKGLVEYYSGYGAQSFYLDIKPLGAE